MSKGDSPRKKLSILGPLGPLALENCLGGKTQNHQTYRSTWGWPRWS